MPCGRFGGGGGGGGGHVPLLHPPPPLGSGTVRSFKFRLDRKSLEQMYVSFIRPVLQYSGIVWDNCNDDKQAVEKIQIEALRIITGSSLLTEFYFLLLFCRFLFLLSSFMVSCLPQVI